MSTTQYRDEEVAAPSNAKVKRTAHTGQLQEMMDQAANASPMTTNSGQTTSNFEKVGDLATSADEAKNQEKHDKKKRSKKGKKEKASASRETTDKNADDDNDDE